MNFQEGDESIIRKYKDNGDGSYTEYVETSVTVGDVTVSGGLTDSELRASDVKVSLDGEKEYLAPDTYLGQEVINGNGASQNATIPSGASFVWASTVSGIAYAAVNTSAAPTTAGWYIPQDQVRIIGPFSNLTSLGVYAASGVYVHLVYGN